MKFADLVDKLKRRNRKIQDRKKFFELEKAIRKIAKVPDWQLEFDFGDYDKETPQQGATNEKGEMLLPSKVNPQVNRWQKREEEAAAIEQAAPPTPVKNDPINLDYYPTLLEEKYPAIHQVLKEQRDQSKMYHQMELDWIDSGMKPEERPPVNPDEALFREYEAWREQNYDDNGGQVPQEYLKYHTRHIAGLAQNLLKYIGNDINKITAVVNRLDTLRQLEVKGIKTPKHEKEIAGILLYGRTNIGKGTVPRLKEAVDMLKGKFPEAQSSPAPSATNGRWNKAENLAAPIEEPAPEVQPEPPKPVARNINDLDIWPRIFDFKILEEKYPHIHNILEMAYERNRKSHEENLEWIKAGRPSSPEDTVEYNFLRDYLTWSTDKYDGTAVPEQFKQRHTEKVAQLAKNLLKKFGDDLDKISYVISRLEDLYKLQAAGKIKPKHETELQLLTGKKALHPGDTPCLKDALKMLKGEYPIEINNPEPPATTERWNKADNLTAPIEEPTPEVQPEPPVSTGRFFTAEDLTALATDPEPIKTEPENHELTFEQFAAKEWTPELEAEIKEYLERFKKELVWVKEGRIPPSKIIGKGYKNPKAAAIEFLEKTIRENELSLKNKYPYIMLHNYRYYVKHALMDGKEIPLSSQKSYNEVTEKMRERDEDGFTFSDDQRYEDFNTMKKRLQEAGLIRNQ